MALTEKMAIVTGASSGFGLLTCLALAGNDCRVITTMRSREQFGQLLEPARRRGFEQRIECVELELADMEKPARMAADIINRYGKIDVLVNNAGYAKAGFAEDLELSDYRGQFEINVFALINMTKAVLPHMRRARSGKIINVSSVSGRIGFPALSAYSASKFAIEGFSESLRLELLPYGVRVVLVEPGSYKTPIWNKERLTMPPDSPYSAEIKRYSRMMEKTAENAGDPEEVARLIARIAAEQAPKLRYPIGQGVKKNLLLKSFLPWKWIERAVASTPYDEGKRL